MTPLSSLWEQVENLLEGELTMIGFTTWINTIIPVSMHDNLITLCVQSDMHKKMIDIRYRDIIKSALYEVSGTRYEIDVVTDDFTKKPETPTQNPAPIIETNELNPKYTFDNFIVGSSNAIAHAAALAVAEAPSIAYNPLFLYSGVGLGKTHLLHAIGNYIQQNSPSLKICLLAAESFTTELIRSIKTNTVEQFKDRYRNVDVLLLDDIQFVGGKAATEEELFHTFNALHQSNKQIVFTSDQPPKDIPNLAERLKTRMGWGLVCDLTPPNFETRMAILKQKVEKENLHIDEDVLIHIATTITSNIRDLEGAFNTVIAYQGLTKTKIDVEKATEAISNYQKSKPTKQITPDLIIRATAKYFRVSPEDIKSKRKTADLVNARQTAMYLCKVLTNSSFTKIGDIFNKDRTTIMYGIKKIEEEINSNEDLKNLVDTLIKDITEE